jgi:hypothetical protein
LTIELLGIETHDNLPLRVLTESLALFVIAAPVVMAAAD